MILFFAGLLLLWGWFFRLPLVVLYRLLPLLSLGLVAGLLVLLGAPPAAGASGAWADLPQGRWLGNLLLKSALAVLLMSGPAACFTERHWLVALQGLHLPGGVVALLYLMLRNLGQLRAEALRLMRAREARGGGGRGYRGLVTAAGISQTWLTRLGQRADWQALALCARNYIGTFPDLGEQRLSWREGLIIILVGGGLAWAVWHWL